MAVTSAALNSRTDRTRDGGSGDGCINDEIDNDVDDVEVVVDFKDGSGPS